MGIVHFLNVKEGDCSIIEHPVGHNTVIDVCNAKEETESTKLLEEVYKSLRSQQGNHQQKSYPVNPIIYMKDRGMSSVFRFILSHPDMDHMDGIKAFFDEFGPNNFWDIENKKEIDFISGSPYNKEDWEFYKKLRKGDVEGVTKLNLLCGAEGQYYNKNSAGEAGGDGLRILSPNQELIKDAIEVDDYNDCSYVIKYQSNAGKIIFAGDSHDKTWDYILDKYADDVADADLLIAPHHGRKSGRSYKFLDIVKPKLTFFGNAASKHLAYSAWNYRNLPFITNNQADCMIVDTNGDNMVLYVTYEKFAKKLNPYATYDNRLKAYYVGTITETKELLRQKASEFETV